MIGQLEPKVVMPMQYATAIGDKKLGALEPFCKALGVPVPDAGGEADAAQLGPDRDDAPGRRSIPESEAARK